jgi:hypothetical protein
MAVVMARRDYRVRWYRDKRQREAVRVDTILPASGQRPTMFEVRTTTKRWARVLLSAAAICLAFSDARAEIFGYDNDNQRFGAALVVPIGRRELVRKTMEFCGTAYPASKADTQIAYAGWVRRHAGYLRLSTTMRNGFAAALAKVQSEKAAEARKLLEYGSSQIEKMSTLLVQALADMPSDDAKRQMCSDTVAKVDARALDIENTDPEITKYFRSVAPKYHVDVSTPGVTSASEVPNARRDAAVLLGRWRSERVVYRMADGTINEGPGGCTFEFSETRLVTECRRNDRDFRVVYSYRASDAGRYESEILENKAFPTLVGARATGTFRVEDGKLFTSAFPSMANGETTRPVEIESVSVRDTTSGGVKE